GQLRDQAQLAGRTRRVTRAQAGSGRAAAGVVSAGVGHVVRRVEAVVDRAGWRRCRAAVLYRAVRRVLRERVGPLGEVVAPRTTVVVPLRFVLAGQVRTAVGGDLQ